MLQSIAVCSAFDQTGLVRDVRLDCMFFPYEIRSHTKALSAAPVVPLKPAPIARQVPAGEPSPVVNAFHALGQPV